MDKFKKQRHINHLEKLASEIKNESIINKENYNDDQIQTLNIASFILLSSAIKEKEKYFLESDSNEIS